MAKTFKSLIPTLILALLVGLVSCNSNRNKLQKAVDKLQNDTPASLGYGVVLDNVNLSGDNLIMDFSVDENIVPVGYLSIIEDDFKQGVKEGIKGKKDGEELIRICKEEGIDMVFKFKGNHAGEYTITVRADELN